MGATWNVQRIHDKVQSTVPDPIELLVECDRAYVRTALGFSLTGQNLRDETYRNTEFGALLHGLSFEVRVCTPEMPLGGIKSVASNEECPFPFSLMRTIGNYMNACHVVVLHWRGIRKEKEMNQSKLAAATSAKYSSELLEPLWLQFDDDLIEPIPPRNVSEMACVLFYRRRRLMPANIAKYSTLDE